MGSTCGFALSIPGKIVKKEKKGEFKHGLSPISRNLNRIHWKCV